jgi:hypothetical protein
MDLVLPQRSLRPQRKDKGSQHQHETTEKSLTYRRARKERKEKIKNIKVNSVFS